MTFTVSAAVILPVVVGQPVLTLANWTFFHAFQTANGKKMRKMS
jgi:hypothetical protein